MLVVVVKDERGLPRGRKRHWHQIESILGSARPPHPTMKREAPVISGQLVECRLELQQAPEGLALSRLRPAAKQGPRTQFIKIRWHDLQELSRERDSLWQAASDDTRTDLEETRWEYGRNSG
jgi:hypothetical protein